MVGSCGSTDAAAERREGGREVVVEAGGDADAFGATELRCTLAARIVGAGVGGLLDAVTGAAADAGVTLSFNGILMVTVLVP